MNKIVTISKWMVFFGLGCMALMSLGLWVLPMWFRLNIVGQLNLDAGILMMATFAYMLTLGMYCWMKTEKK
ncbi:MAG: hypothetical protein J5613_04245 [Alphaproteobacteria bacterium]|nr:hypothetical protein [Alphaproteobacteria bacterium]